MPHDTRGYVEAQERAEQRMMAAAHGTSGRGVPDCITEQVTADLLGLTPVELRQLDVATVYAYMGYHEGKALAEWCREHPASPGRIGE